MLAGRLPSTAAAGASARPLHIPYHIMPYHDDTARSHLLNAHIRPAVDMGKSADAVQHIAVRSRTTQTVRLACK